MIKNMAQLGPIARQWGIYAAHVMPADAPVTETRRAYYAGAWALYEIMMRQMDSEREPTADDVMLMQLIDAELRAFVGDVEAGRR